MNLRNLLFTVVIVVILAAAVLNVALFTAKDESRTTPGGDQTESQIRKELGATPIFYEPAVGIPQDEKIHFVFLYYTTCPACEDDKNLFISKSFPAWQGNLSSEEVSFRTLNYYRKKDVGDAYFRAFNISKNQFGATALVIHDSKVGLVFYPPFNDGKIQKAAYYIAKGSLLGMTQKKSETHLSQPLVFALGAISGFNPCLIALASFFFATATKTELKAVARRIGLISLGLVYAYLIFFSLLVTNPAVMNLTVSLAWLVVLLLVTLALIHFVEVAHDIYSRRWGGGSSIEAKMPLFKTPRFLKDLIAKARAARSPTCDFTLGAVFSLVKLPCIAVFLLVLLVNSTTPLVDVAVFTLGVAAPVILMGLLIGLGMVQVNRLSTAQFKGRLIQRTLIGIALLASVFFVLP
jgi:cytochrome c biogenesis protein CcdA